jgi:hypothetical protein
LNSKYYILQKNEQNSKIFLKIGKTVTLPTSPGT